jgi:CubicO group peptidase (beta-lactamase class C family)
MNALARRRFALAVTLLTLLWVRPAAPAEAAREAALAPATPAAVGLSAERLARLDRFLDDEIAAKRKAGAVVLIARHGRIAYFRAYGEADSESHRPMRTDNLFRMQSMTKPVTSVALLTLYEQGKFQLTDPLEKYLPAFKNVRVYKGTGPSGELLLEDPKHPITIEDVFRHTAGFSYGYFSDTPVDHAYRDAGVSYEKSDSLKEFTDKLATMPLLYQPGTKWHYSFAHEVQAYLVEYFSGMPFDAYCQKVIFGPLGMKDTVFGVPPEKAARFAAVYHPDAAGRALPGLAASDGLDYTHFTGRPFGGASLSSTAGDYLRFAQMLLNGGRLDGVRILSRKTVELMTADHLAPAIPPLRPGVGYGLGVGVVIDPAQAGSIGSAGEFFWGGYATTSVIINPKEQLVGLLLAQYQPMDFPMIDRWKVLLYQAIAD